MPALRSKPVFVGVQFLYIYWCRQSMVQRLVVGHKMVVYGVAGDGLVLYGLDHRGQMAQNYWVGQVINVT